MQRRWPKSVGSIEKKRARDRRAQQNLRAKRTMHVETLESNLALMEQKCANLDTELETLRSENRLLQARQTGIHTLVDSWQVEDESIDQTHGAVHVNWVAASPATYVYSFVSSLDETMDRRDHGLIALPSLIPTSIPPSIQPCSGAYYSSRRYKFFCDSFNLCLARPDLILASPNDPEPLDLLYGSRANLLANLVHKATRFWRCSDVERFASGLLAYRVTKWLVQPTDARLACLYEFQKPVPEQLSDDHPCGIDYIHWPEIRANLVRNYQRYDLVRVLGLFACCAKVRWPWGQNFLQRDKNNCLRVRRDFYDTFTVIEGWGLTDDFGKEYPELLEGLDVASIRYGIL